MKRLRQLWARFWDPRDICDPSPQTSIAAVGWIVLCLTVAALLGASR